MAQKPSVSATVEGGLGLEYKGKLGTVEVKGGGALKGEVEVSTKRTKVDAAAEGGVNVGPVKLGGARAEIVTKNEQGESGSPSLTFTKPGISRGSSEVTGWKQEITLSFAVYEGAGGGVSITIRPQQMFDSAANWLKSNPSPGVDFNTNQHGIGAWQ